MKTYSTIIIAKDPSDGGLKKWSGPNVPGISFDDATEYCQNNGLGYCKVDGVLIAEVPVINGKTVWDKKIDYETPFKSN